MAATATRPAVRKNFIRVSSRLTIHPVRGILPRGIALAARSRGPNTRRSVPMRIAMDPVPVVLGIYAHVGELLARVMERHEGGDAESLGRRFGRQRAEAADREGSRLGHALHAGVKVADHLLEKPGDAWEISRQAARVD